MPNNRHEINELELVWGAPSGYGANPPPPALAPPPHSITQAKLLKKLRVREGTAAVITLDGQYRETLQPGATFLGRYPPFQRCEIYWVDTKDRQLTINTSGEFKIMDPVPLDVDLTVVVSYRAVEPRVAALDISQPLGTLYDYVIESMRDACKHARFDDFLVGGTAASRILQHLQAREIENYLGLQILNVLISSIEADARALQLLQDEGLSEREVAVGLRAEELQAHQRMRLEMDQAANQRDVAKMLDMSPEYVALYMPEMFERIYGNRLITEQARMQGLIELAKAGMLDLSALSSGSGDMAEALKGLLGVQPGQKQQPLLAGKPAPGAATVTAKERLVDEVEVLQEQGWSVVRFSEDMGSHYIVVALQDQAGNQLQVYFVCPPKYPTDPPGVFIELNGAEETFNSTIIDNWNYRNTLLDVLTQVLDYYA